MKFAKTLLAFLRLMFESSIRLAHLLYSASVVRIEACVESLVEGRSVGEIGVSAVHPGSTHYQAVY